MTSPRGRSRRASHASLEKPDSKRRAPAATPGSDAARHTERRGGRAMVDIWNPPRKERALLVGHNAHFDLSFVNAACNRANYKRNPFHPFSVLDTATLAGAVLGQTVLKRALDVSGLGYDGNEAHSAIYDAERTADLFCLLVNRLRPVYDTFAVLAPEPAGGIDA